MTAFRFLTARLAPLLAIASAAGCGGNNSTAFVGPSGPCSYFNATIALIAPAPGTTGVPDAFPQVIVATSTAFPTTYDAVVTGTIGGVTQQIFFNTFIASALPVGTTPPSFANPHYYASTNPSVTFDAKSPISIALNDSGSTCTPGATIGSFTVQ